MTTVYFICVHPAVNPELADRERCQVIWRDAFSTRRNFLSTHIRHRLCFHMPSLHQRTLMRCMILPTLIRPLVFGVGQSAHAGLFERTTVVVAVTLSSIVAATDEERRRATAAAQLEDEYVVHRPSAATTTANLPRASAPSIVCSKPVSSAGGLGLQSGALVLFGVLASGDRNGEIFHVASLPPIELTGQITARWIPSRSWLPGHR